MMRRDVRAKLIEIARKRKTITYGDLMREFGIPRGNPKPGIGIGSVVGEISEYEHSKGRPLLSGIVVRADSKTKKCPQGHPAGAFFGLDGVPLCLRRSQDAFSDPLTIKEQKFIKKEQERVWNYWKNPRRR